MRNSQLAHFVASTRDMPLHLAVVCQKCPWMQRRWLPMKVHAARGHRAHQASTLSLLYCTVLYCDVPVTVTIATVRRYVRSGGWLVGYTLCSTCTRTILSAKTRSHRGTTETTLATQFTLARIPCESNSSCQLTLVEVELDGTLHRLEAKLLASLL